ncbi:MAG: MFS transporter [Candidatus Hydrogenedentes bacterium]|nr:MFS transporter [Candidatus Hydrogenedentota bacterium]
MNTKRLEPKAQVALTLHGLCTAARTLCEIFVSVYFWRVGRDFGLVCWHYFAVFAVTPVVFLASGWLAQRWDRLYPYRLGVVLYAVYYLMLLILRERSSDYAVLLGALLGVTWGCYWSGVNTFNFDVTEPGNRERYFGFLQAISSTMRFAAPLAGGALITLASDNLMGYYLVFALAIACYISAFVLSFWMPRDRERRPYRLKRALFPGKDQRDWRLIMAAAFTLAGMFNIFAFLLGLLMYMKTENELNVGGLASIQSIAAIITAIFVGRTMRPRSRMKYMRWGVAMILAAGVMMFTELTLFTLVLFGLLRSMAAPFFGIAHFSLRMDAIANCAEAPHQRIEYISAWEVPLAVGRVVMMLVIIGLSDWLTEGELGIRIALFMLCALRMLTYFLLSKTSVARG